MPYHDAVAFTVLHCSHFYRATPSDLIPCRHKSTFLLNMSTFFLTWESAELSTAERMAQSVGLRRRCRALRSALKETRCSSIRLLATASPPISFYLVTHIYYSFGTQIRLLTKHFNSETKLSSICLPL